MELPAGVTYEVISPDCVNVYRRGQHIGDVDQEHVGVDDPENPDRMVWRIIPLSYRSFAHTNGLPYAADRDEAIRLLATGEYGPIGGVGIH